MWQIEHDVHRTRSRVGDDAGVDGEPRWRMRTGRLVEYGELPPRRHPETLRRKIKMYVGIEWTVRRLAVRIDRKAHRLQYDGERLKCVVANLKRAVGAPLVFRNHRRNRLAS